MRGRLKEIQIEGRRVAAYTPEAYVNGGRYPVIYSNNGDLDTEEFERIFWELEKRTATGECCEFLFVAIPPSNENDDYSPWPAAPAFRGSAVFGGKGCDYTRWLIERFVPAFEAEHRTLTSCRCLMGYSLGGLHALWTACQTGFFQGCGSLSGSLWFDGWDEYIATHMPTNSATTIYLSLGASEEKSRSPRLSKVGDRTRETYRLLQQGGWQENELTLEWNQGGHFDEIPTRFAKAAAWLTRPERRWLSTVKREGF